jgi:hypothetical protein
LESSLHFLFFAFSRRRLLEFYDALDSHSPETMAEIDKVSGFILEPLKTVHETRPEEVFGTLAGLAI